MTAIAALGLTKRFRRLRTYRDLVLYPWRRDEHLAVDDLSFEVGRGELFALLGENGAGKTTIIRMLSTTLLPTSGQAIVDGHDVVANPHRVRRLIGVVNGEERSFYWRLTGRQNLEFFAHLHHVQGRTAAHRISELAELVGIRDALDDQFFTYSTGTRHKLAIARALLTEPRILFLDEPTRSLDPEAVLDVRHLLLDRIVAEGRTVLLTTHSLAEAEAVCTRVAIIRAGRLVASGTLADLRDQLQLSTACDVRLRGPLRDLANQVAGVPGVTDVTCQAVDGGGDLSMRLGRGEGVLDAVLRTLLAGGAHITSCTTREPALDEIYRRVVAQDRRDRADRSTAVAPG